MKNINKLPIFFVLFLMIGSHTALYTQDLDSNLEKYPGKKLYCDYERAALQLIENSEDKSADNIILTEEEDYKQLISWLESRQSFVTMYSDSKMGESAFFTKNSGEEIIPVIANVDLPVNMPVKVSLKKSENLKMDEMLIYDEKLK